jgi:hypothetical protein
MKLSSVGQCNTHCPNRYSGFTAENNGPMGKSRALLISKENFPYGKLAKKLRR